MTTSVITTDIEQNMTRRVNERCFLCPSDNDDDDDALNGFYIAVMVRE